MQPVPYRAEAQKNIPGIRQDHLLLWYDTLVWERKVGKPPRPGPHRSSPGLVRETNEWKKVKRTAFMTFPSPGMNHMVGKFRGGGILCRVLKKEQKKSPWVFFLEAPSSFHKYPKRLSAPRQAKRKPLAPGIREAATGSCAPFLSPLPLDQGEWWGKQRSH